MHSLKGTKNVIDVRNLGLVAGIEVSPRHGKPGARAGEAFLKCYEKGLLVRATGDIIALSPSLIVAKDQIDTMVSILGDVLSTLS